MSDTNVTTNAGSSVSQASERAREPQLAWAPAVDIAESESGITVIADLPGVSKERLSIKVEGDSLTIEGRAQLDVPENVELIHSEVRHPYFRRTFMLSRDLDPARIEATLKNGVLQMHVPTSEEARPKRIEVKVA